jgi:lipopolysaccharide transport system ATP-binding protein
MTQESAISLQQISKIYRVWNNPEARLKSLFWSALGRKAKSEGLYRDFCALKDLNLEIPRGQSLGIIGLNGSGKSTLLQIIAGTLRPSTGKVDVRGRVAALLELGAGFNPDFSGRENVYLNAAVLGLSREETDARFTDIAAFADIGDYIEQPVKTYSSGMYVRLGFAVMTQVSPDILIVDEALSVGDFLFQQKCYDTMRKLRARGITFLFVSHGMGTILELCDRAVVLDRGQMIFEGEPKKAVDLYEAHSLRSRFGVSNKVQTTGTAEATLPLASVPPAPEPAPAPIADGSSAPDSSAPPINRQQEPSIHTDSVSLIRVSLLDNAGTEKRFVVSGESVRLVISVLFHRAVRDPHIGFKIRNHLGAVLYETNTFCLRHHPGQAVENELVTAEFTMLLRLAEGEYSITAAVANEGSGRWDFAEALLFQHGTNHFVVTRDWSQHDWSGMVNLDATVRTDHQSNHVAT